MKESKNYVLIKCNAASKKQTTGNYSGTESLRPVPPGEPPRPGQPTLKAPHPPKGGGGGRGTGASADPPPPDHTTRTGNRQATTTRPTGNNPPHTHPWPHVQLDERSDPPQRRGSSHSPSRLTCACAGPTCLIYPAARELAAARRTGLLNPADLLRLSTGLQTFQGWLT